MLQVRCAACEKGSHSQSLIVPSQLAVSSRAELPGYELPPQSTADTASLCASQVPSGEPVSPRQAYTCRNCKPNLSRKVSCASHKQLSITENDGRHPWHSDRAARNVQPTWQSAEPAKARAASASPAACGTMASDVSADIPSGCSETCFAWTTQAVSKAKRLESYSLKVASLGQALFRPTSHNRKAYAPTRLPSSLTTRRKPSWQAARTDRSEAALPPAATASAATGAGSLASCRPPVRCVKLHCVCVPSAGAGAGAWAPGACRAAPPRPAQFRAEDCPGAWPAW